MKNIMRIISLLLCFTVVLSCQPAFFLVVQGIAKEFPQADGAELISENFDSGTRKGEYTWVDSNKGGTVSVVNGALNIDRTTNSGTTYTKLYFDADKQGVKGLYGLEFTLTKGAKNFNLQIENGSDKVVRIQWLAAGGLTANGIEIGTYTDEIKVQMLLDTDNDKYNLWVNEIFFEQDIAFDVTDGDTMTNIYMYLSGGAIQTVTVDDIRFFEVATSGDEGSDGESGDDNTGDEDADALPEEVRVGEYLIDEDFEDDEYDITWTTPDYGSIDVSGKNLQLNREANTSNIND